MYLVYLPEFAYLFSHGKLPYKLYTMACCLLSYGHRVENYLSGNDWIIFAILQKVSPGMCVTGSADSLAGN